jgi:queuine tRNA-ribosyltransferase
MNRFTFTLAKTLGKARMGTFATAHGVVKTPIFMPVGTAASVKALDAQDIEATHAQIILANTYHLYLRPGTELLESAGGVHQFMQWHQPMLTDSGGFQVFSLGLQQEKKDAQNQVKMTEDGVEFTSHIDGSAHFFSPEKAIKIQRSIGADIIMAFDECTPDEASYEYAREALDRTHRWLERCVAEWESHQRLSQYGTYQALFGIVQGGLHRELRQESAAFVAAQPVDGIALGGETIGYNMQGTAEVMAWVEDSLPQDKPRYAMGLGRDPQDIVDAVLMGFDMFDCVGPTRLARNGALYHGQLVVDKTQAQPVRFISDFPKSRLPIGNRQFASDHLVLQEDCDCWTCTHGYTRAYLHHLYRAKELSYYRLASIHNIRTMIRIAEQLRSYIENG